MKCFHCGTETLDYLCPACRSEETLDKIFQEIRFYKPENCANAYLAEYANGLADPKSLRDCIPSLLNLFPENVSEYYYCVYFWMQKDSRFESSVEKYLSCHARIEHKSQTLIAYLLDTLYRHDFFKPRAYCDWIMECAEGVSSELYLRAAEYYAQVGEYDLADRAIEKGLACKVFLYTDAEKMQGFLDKQRDMIKRYRTQRPYWPKNEENRRKLAVIYDEKGIIYPRIDTKPIKILESEFEPITECADLPKDYCAFWCAEGFSIGSAKPIYQIAAVRVQNGKETDSFQSLIRPQDNARSRSEAAKSAGVPLDAIENAEDVDQVMTKFFAFVQDAVLVSTGALGRQAKLISRAARYTGMKKIHNSFVDLLDIAADKDEKFDRENNTREFLLQYFGVSEGGDALGKARANLSLCEKVRAYGK